MPFTLAHPAAALPFYARWRNGFLAMVVGSMGPDIPYFLPSGIGDSLPPTHTALAAITVATPLALVALVVMIAARGIVIAPLWGAFCVALDRELAHARSSQARAVQAIPAVIVGCEIHILWDSFTHKNGWAALHVPALTHNVSPIAAYPLDLTRALQYVSSVVGIAIVVVWSRQHLRQAEAAGPPPGFRPWALMGLLVISGLAAWRAVWQDTQPIRSHGWEYLASTSLVGTFVVLYFIWGVVLEIIGSMRRD